MACHSRVFLTLFALLTLLHSTTAQEANIDRYVVLDNMGWSVPSTGDTAYRTWASGKDFEVGDTLVFNFPTGAHDVAEVSRAAYDSCNGTNPISRITTGPANITLRTAGQHYFICTVPGHCQGGQKLAITVEGADAPEAPDNDANIDMYVVLDNQGWVVPANGDGAYRAWAAGKDFEVGDTLVFNFATGQHTVAEVTRAAYDSCNGTSPLLTQTTGPANITLRTSGPHYYICTVPGHCQGGQKLAITVEASSTPLPPTPPTGSPAPRGSPPPSGTTPPNGSSPPTGSSQPGGPSPPTGSAQPGGPSPPNSGSSSIAVSGFVSIVLSIAMTFLF